MTTVGPDNYRAFVLIPVSAVKLQERMMSELQKKVSALEKETQNSGRSAKDMDGQGEGNGLGVPADALSPKVSKVSNTLNDIVPEGDESSAMEHPEVFPVYPDDSKRDKPPIDRDLPNSLPPTKTSILDRSRDGLAPNSGTVERRVTFAAEPSHKLKGGEADSSESEDEQPPYYIGNYYPVRVRFH